jgi:SAM-dependent methyltransferase
MSGFSAEWLALRRVADQRARWREGAMRYLRALPDDHALPLLDMACGSGANCRYLAALLAEPREWLLVDHDAVLLTRARDECAALPGVRGLLGRQLDLARDLDCLDLRNVAGLSAAALLDLVSQPWLERLVAVCAASRLPLLFALSFDGRIKLSPGDAEDENIRQAVNQHQRSDKGFGPALGPTATTAATPLLQAQGYQVAVAASDWQLDAADPVDAALLSPLLQGWASAAGELAPSAASRQRVALWLRQRERAVAAGALQVQVGHHDLLALI